MFTVSWVLLCAFAMQVAGYVPSYNIPYCSHDLAALNARTIPPLTYVQRKRVQSLEQVQVIARHGARSPALRECKCWKNYEPWNNCTVSELMIETISKTVAVPWYYRKVYDGSPNYFHGDCMSGQLLVEGYQQELHNGQILRQAYLDPSSTDDLTLFQSKNWSDVESEVYIRSDDEQRTLMSGQLIVNEMFEFEAEAVIPVHTGDLELDQMDPNKVVCPRLGQVRDEAFQTAEFKQWIQSPRVSALSKILDSIFGADEWSWGCILDCTMTSACTKRHIPDGDGWVKLSDDIMKEITKEVDLYYRHLFEYNHTEYSTLSMGNLAWQLRAHIEDKLGMLPAASKRSPVTDGHKFHLFAAHDFTLLPLLTKMAPNAWDRSWPPYASLLSIELYKANPTVDQSSALGYLFRVVYNSKVFTLDGCADSLCDVEVLLNILSFGREVMPCGLHTVSQAADTSSEEDSLCFVSQADFTGYMMLAVVLSCLLSVAATVAVFMFCFGTSCKRLGYAAMNKDLELDTMNSMHAPANIP